ncbi:hypothetical protein RCL1_003575 [Eukaryota sp. TZLM3-RCL]
MLLNLNAVIPFTVNHSTGLLASRCPCCRTSSPAFKPNIAVRRMIDSLPSTCPNCHYGTCRGNLKQHLKKCPEMILSCRCCAISLCRQDFLSHVVETHAEEVVKFFSEQEKSDSNIIAISVFVGDNGKHYCGRKILSCSCCDGYCGPRYGCNCLECMKLDLRSTQVPLGFLINREGRVAGRTGTGRYQNRVYCGAGVLTDPMTDGHCGPTDRPQCRACKKLESQWNR